MIYKNTCTLHTKRFSCKLNNETRTAILIIIEGRFQVFQRFSSGKLVLNAVESCFAALNYYENGSKTYRSTENVISDDNTYKSYYMLKKK
jgi:hypothetical protein